MHIGKWTAIAGISLLLAVGALYASGARMNTTHSIPVGLYWKSNLQIANGVYVMFCPPHNANIEEAKQRGYIKAGPCPGGYGYLMKRILASSGDIIDVTDAGVSVNGKALPYSTPLAADNLNQPLPYFRTSHQILSDDELLVMTDVNSRSFDSRYFGPISKSQVRDVIIPLLTW
ncbi:conjugation peptidase TraF [Pseudomonas duriflava]|uniref:Conjugation peptidase TraF n=1 Tax=Pseudomonas duriflava TaxID=459528 RepID=A0A562PTQ5_9PSED|nr:conjugative transfer signal peptidase TraF [Pseudomonas duriflava]TWI47779.1 conjugation peptidase TraF [Pseudomonas duriflava]